MRRVLLFLMILGLTATVAFSQQREARPVSGFTGINASSVFDITVTKGNTESLSIEADNNVLQHVRSEVRNGVLHLYLDNPNQLRNIRTLRAAVVVRNLDQVTLSGACKLTANDVFTSDDFKINCSGVSNLEVNINTGQLSIGMSGASKVRMKAEVTGEVRMNLSGTSNIQGELKAASVRFNSSGASVVELNGSATYFHIGASGTSNVKAENFTVRNATIQSSGACRITVNVADTLLVNSSGTSSVHYRGSPSTEINNSRRATVRKI